MKSTAATISIAVNAHGKIELDRLEDIMPRIQEVALHGIRYGVTRGLVAVEFQSGADLIGSLSPNFMEEQNHIDFDSFTDDFAPLGDALADTASAEDIVNKVFLE